MLTSMACFLQETESLGPLQPPEQPSAESEERDSEDGTDRRQFSGMVPPNTRGVVIGESFVPGTTGKEWAEPLGQDLLVSADMLRLAVYRWYKVL
jgi:hypothetical protein